MISPSKPIYRVGDLEIDPARCCLRRNGRETHLRLQAFQVLLYLLDHRRRLVTKDELVAQFWPKTATTDDALVQCIVEIRRSLGDDSRHPRFIKTIPKIGYCFIGPVEEEIAPPVVVEIEESTTIEIEVEDAPRQVSQQVAEMLRQNASRSRKNIFPGVIHNWPLPAVFTSLLIAGLIASGAFAAYLLMRERRPAAEIALPRAPGKKSVAVAPFENQSGEPEFDWLHEGLADMLITSLSRSKNLTVLSRQQLAVLLDRIGRQGAKRLRLEDSLEIARRSQAEVIIVGGFAKLGEKMRVDASILDARNGQLLSAESLTVNSPEQILSQIDLLSLRLAARLGATMTEAESKPGLSGVMTDSLEAYRYYSLALEKANAYHSAEAIEFLEKAIALDPQFAMAYARVGYIYTMVRVNEADKARPYLEKAFQFSNRLTDKERLYIKAWYATANGEGEAAARALYELIEQYPQEIEAYFRLGFLLRHGMGRRDEALRVFERAVAVDPDAKDIHNQLGFLYLGFGRYDEAIAAHQRYAQLAPDEANAFDSLGMTYNEAGRYDEAMASFNRALTLNPDFHFAIRHLGDTYFHLGRYRAALSEYQRYLKIAPSDWDRAMASNLIARVYLARGDVKSAEASARQEQKYHNDFGGLMLTALARDDLETAGNLYPRLTASAPGRQPAFEPRLRVYLFGAYDFKKGRIDEALKQFEEARRLYAFYWNIDTEADCIAQAYYKLGRTDEAIAEYENLSKINPNWAPGHYRVAQAYERKGDRDRARAAYRSFLQIWKDADADIPEVAQAKSKTAN